MIIIYFVLILYAILSVLLLFFVKQHKTNGNNNYYNKFSVVIASKNEGLNIKNLIDSLKKIYYKKEYFEIIFIDDDSTDNTKFLIQQELNDFENAKYILAQYKKYKGKKGAIDLGINAAKNDYIVVTDSDCIVNPKWLLSLNKCINNGNEFIIGVSPFYQNKGFVNLLSCFENLRTILITIFSTKIKLPYTATARNICFKKTFYNEINGFENLQNTLSGDDDLLLREAIKKKIKIEILTDAESFVFSNTKITVKDYLNQKFRHTSTSYHYSIKQSLFPSIWHISNSVLFLSPVLFFLTSYSVIPFFVKLIFDIFVILLKQKTFNYKFGIFEIIVFQIIYEFLIIFKFPVSYFYKKRW